MMENILNIGELEKSKKKLLRNISIVISCIVIILIYRIITKGDVDDPYLETTLFCIRIFNFILALLASGSCLNSYERLRDNSVFIISLVYMSLSTGIFFGQIDRITFYYDNYGISNYIVIFPLILRVILLIISMNSDWKINNFIVRNKIKSISFVILYTIILGILEIKMGMVIKYNDVSIIVCRMILILVYIISTIILFRRGIKKKEYLFIVLSISIFMLGIKSIFSIFTIENVSFYTKLISVCITSISSLIIIGGSLIELYIYINKSTILTENLKVFHNIVDNDKHSFMLICNEKGDTIYANKKIKDYYCNLGYNGMESLNSLFHKISDELGNSNEVLKSLHNTGSWRGIIKNGFDEMMLDCTMQLVDGLNNKEIAISCMDISDDIKKELELEKLKIYTNEKTEFISNISHELRTPLNIFYSTIQLLDRIYLNNDDEFKLIYEKYRKTLHINCKRMLRLINNVIDISKIETGTLNGRFDNYNIVSVVEDVTLSVVNYAKLKNINIQFDVNTEEKIIKCNPNLIERLMLNLLSNAIKFSPQNSTIYVDVYINKDFTEINVKDEGIGISPEFKSTIFERFVQADKSLTRENEGSGIGLSIVKSIIDLHGGYISVDTELGKGSDFKIILPNTSIKDENCKIYDMDNDKTQLELSDIYEVLSMN